MAATGSVAAYRAGYTRLVANTPTDTGIRAADAWVSAHDPLRGLITVGCVMADVALGVDPGSYFCGGLARELVGHAGGFVHVPPDAMLARPLALDFLGVLVAGLLRAVGGDAPVLLTGFGPFPGVSDNPTAAFIADAARMAGACKGRRVTARVLRLSDGEGTMYRGMAEVKMQFEAALAEAGDGAVVLALGVDSRQNLPRPRFTLETQSWGMGTDGPADPVHLDGLWPQLVGREFNLDMTSA